MEKQDKVFADGFIFKRSDNAPDWVVGKLSVKVEDAIAFLKSNAKNGWVNLNINSAKSGKYYMEVDTWEKSKPEVQEWTPASIAAENGRSIQVKRNNNSDLPF